MGRRTRATEAHSSSESPANVTSFRRKLNGSPCLVSDYTLGEGVEWLHDLDLFSHHARHNDLQDLVESLL
jgi:hypothetical protein